MSRFHADESAALAPINRENGYVRWHDFLSAFLGATKQSEILLEQGSDGYATISNIPHARLRKRKGKKMLDATQKVALVTQFWDAFDHGQFHLAGTLLTDDVSVVWPTSRELFAGRASFIHVNEQFPGQWRFLPHTINALDNGQVLSITHVISPDCDDHFFATSLFAFRANQIFAITTYWAFTDEQPAWRQGLSDVY